MAKVTARARPGHSSPSTPTPGRPFGPSEFTRFGAIDPMPKPYYETSSPAASSSVVSPAVANRRVQSSARWFFWIAGLSLLNSLIHQFGGGVTFLFGLGVTQLLDAFFRGIPALSYALDVLPLGFFVLMGYFATKGRIWAFIVGGVAYLLDGLVYATLGLWLPALFHLFVLFSILFGVRELARVRALERSAGSASGTPPPLSPAP